MIYQYNIIRFCCRDLKWYAFQNSTKKLKTADTYATFMMILAHCLKRSEEVLKNQVSLIN